MKPLSAICWFMNKLAESQQQSLIRFISFLLGLTVIGILLFWPKAIMTDLNTVNHSALMLLLIANSGCFIHGIGYIPETWLWRWLFTPLFSWPLNLLFLWSIIA